MAMHRQVGANDRMVSLINSRYQQKINLRLLFSNAGSNALPTAKHLIEKIEAIIYNFGENPIDQNLI